MRPVALWLALCLLVAPLPGRAAPEYLNGSVSQVLDGDSLRLTRADGVVIGVRLHGIDAPEHDQPHGAEARQALAQLIRGRSVTVIVHGRDDHGRVVGEVFVGGNSANRILVREGHAWWYRRYAAEDRDLERLAEAARKARRGLWAQDKPLPPWAHRYLKRRRGG